MSQIINQGQQVRTASDTPIQLTLISHLIISTSSTKEMLTFYLLRL